MPIELMIESFKTLPADIQTLFNDAQNAVESSDELVRQYNQEAVNTMIKSVVLRVFAAICIITATIALSHMAIFTVAVNLIIAHETAVIGLNFKQLYKPPTSGTEALNSAAKWLDKGAQSVKDTAKGLFKIVTGNVNEGVAKIEVIDMLPPYFDNTWSKFISEQIYIQAKRNKLIV